MAFFDFMLGEVEQVAANFGGIDIAARARVAGLAPAAVEMRDDLRGQRDVARAAAIAVVGRGRISVDRVALDLVGGDFAGGIGMASSQELGCHGGSLSVDGRRLTTKSTD